MAEKTEIDLERELQLELEKLDQIFTQNEETLDNKMLADLSSSDSNLHKQQPLYTAFDLAEAEIEKEELQDKLRLLLTKTEEFDTQLMRLSAENHELHGRYAQVVRENERLQQEMAEFKLTNSNGGNRNSVQTQHSDEDFGELEFKLAETRAKLARNQQHLEDISLSRDYLLKELEKERLLRQRTEKERDAYSAAYEASLQHLDKWTKKKSFTFSKLLAGVSGSSEGKGNSVS